MDEDKLDRRIMNCVVKYYRDREGDDDGNLFGGRTEDHVLDEIRKDTEFGREVYSRVKSLVEEGGTGYFSGDVDYEDENESGYT